MTRGMYQFLVVFSNRISGLRRFRARSISPTTFLPNVTACNL